MYLTGDTKVFGKFVSILGIFQGLTWIILSTISIFFYYHTPKKMTWNMDTEYSEFHEYLNRIIYDRFIGGAKDNEGRVLESQDFHVFMWIYLILSAVWVAASIDAYSAIRWNKTRQAHVLLLLGILILLISILDLIFAGLLGRDFSSCDFQLYLTPLEGTPIDCQLAIGIVMTLVARGFVLLALNVVLSIATIIAAARVFNTHMPRILAYEQNTIPRAHMPRIEDKPQIREPDLFYPSISYGPAIPSRTQSSTPVALNNRNQNIYY
ncbi:uncharacterized protein LOC132698432 [Cylas formicarius]|uniref:uncharacterized protein LOC132698432 n=1 Tax=Cylas formicarius TaxID=197179 RepID=UPI002958BBC2|nr:uncharacterized protein LOC132698432 [Cylas formicarius]